MSTRHVWEKYNLTLVTQSQVKIDGDGYRRANGVLSQSDAVWDWEPEHTTYENYYRITNSCYARVGTGYSISNGKITLTNSSVESLNNLDTLSFGATFYSVFDDNTTKVYVGFLTSSVQNSFDRIYYFDVVSSNANNIYLAIDTDDGEKSYLAVSTSKGAFGEIYNSTISRLALSKGTAAGTVSNASSSTYPRHNYTGRITSICAVIPSLIRRCSHVQ